MLEAWSGSARGSRGRAQLTYHWTRLELTARPVERAKDPLTEPTRWELPAILVLVAILAANEIWDWRAEETLNIVAPVWLSLAVGAGALKMANGDGRAMWMPLFWVRVATLIFYGLGNIAPVIMNGASLEYMQSLYFFLPEDLLRVNLNTAVGVGSILFGSLMFERMFVTTQVATVKRPALRSPGGAGRMGAALFLIGAAINYFLILPSFLGVSDIVIPGFLVSLAMSEQVGISLLAIWGYATSKAAVLALVALVAVESAVGVLFLNKGMALTPWFAFLIGAFYYKLTIPRLAAAGLFVFFAFGILQPLVAYGRNEAFNNPANQGAEMSLFRNFEYLRSYFVESKAENDPEAVQGGLMRLSLVNVAAFTIAQYDHGLPGDSIRSVLYSLFRVSFGRRSRCSYLDSSLRRSRPAASATPLAPAISPRHIGTLAGSGWFCSCFRSEPFSTGPRISRLERSRAKTGSTRRCCSSI